MTQYSATSDNIRLFRSLFKGREDVFAVRWEKGKKSGYAPAYFFDPYHYRMYKSGGGDFRNYTGKKHRPLSDQEITKHLNGEQIVGIYPLMQGNTSWFLVADFDGENWIAECRLFLQACLEKGITAYLERSRSGNGGHVWIFFSAPYPALKSRMIFIRVLEGAGIFSKFDKESSFDRLFPSQDNLRGKGFGNLIAFPFQKLAMDQGNACFLAVKSLKPFDDQVAFLKSVQRVPLEKLDQLFSAAPKTGREETTPGHLRIWLSNNIRINRESMPSPLIDFLKEELNFANVDYTIKRKMGRSTWGIRRYFRYVEEVDNEVIIPRGFIGSLIRFCKEKGIVHEFIDQRRNRDRVDFQNNITLRKHQEATITIAGRKDFGVIVAPPGSGKTVIGLQIITDKQQPALIIVHRQQLMDQWIERIEAFLGIPKRDIGKIGKGKHKVGEKVTVAMVQTLAKLLDKPEGIELAQDFGTLIIDECHHLPAQTFQSAFGKLSPYYQYGLTATPFRKNKDEKAIFILLGEVISEIPPQQIETFKKARVIIRNTGLEVPFNPKTDPFENLSKVLIHDTSRNQLILRDVKAELQKGKKVIILTERKAHITALYQFLKQAFEIITLSGDDSDKIRKQKWKQIQEGRYQALITTGQLFGEGSDVKNASCLFLVYPFSFKGKLIQYIGRVQRSEITPLIYDYHDRKIDYLDRLFLKRNTHYRHLDKQATLFDDTGGPIPKADYSIRKTIKIPIEDLDFRYGAIAFQYQDAKVKEELEFEIENDEMRPEFDVLKPYFGKVLRSNSIRAAVQAEFENGVLVAQDATSADLEDLNREIIESVKFRLLEKQMLQRPTTTNQNENLLDIDQVQVNTIAEKLYDSGKSLLDSILSQKKVKHYRQLRYLAGQHAHQIMKLRFVLQPFSFVFLLQGEHQFHVVLETLDTEEATYIWHIEKDQQLLRQELSTIDKDLGQIRNKGRKAFLKKSPKQFSKILHDYSDERKGFVRWKGALEERLV